MRPDAPAEETVAPGAPGEPDTAPGLTPDRIVRAALDLVEEGGFAALKMRDLSDRLGVTLGATYRHVGSKDELLSLAATELLTSVELPGPDFGSWRQRLRAFLLEFMETLSRHPGVVTYVLSRSSDFRDQRRIDPVHELLVEVGFSPEVARRWAQATSFYVTGALLMDIQEMRRQGYLSAEDLTAGLDLLMDGMGEPGTR